MLSGKFKEGEVACRLKGDMLNQNYVMRDPIIFRIVDHPHPLQGKKYIVYPTYDFANSVEDAICGVTHVVRSNEFAPRTELQNFIRTSLGYPNPEVIQYSRFNLEGSPTSKREIKKLVEDGQVTGWDDPRLSTLMGLRRRGIIPETIRELTIQIGLSTSQPVISWELLLSHNRKHLDKLANRYFFVQDPVKIKVKNAPPRKVKLRLHPSEDRGFREIETTDTFYIPGNEELKGEIRLKDLYNIKLTGKGEAEYTGDELKKDIPKIQWIPEKFTEFKMLVPGILIKDGKYDKDSLKTVTGYGEEALGKLKPGTIVQLERIGFARVDSSGVLCFTSN
jgi:glutamyl-tRNA synthetase